MKFQKGNPGKPKGAKHKLPQKAKEALALAFEGREQDRSPGIDWKTGLPAKRPNPQDEIASLFGAAANVGWRQSNKRPRW